MPDRSSTRLLRQRHTRRRPGIAATPSGPAASGRRRGRSLSGCRTGWPAPSRPPAPLQRWVEPARTCPRISRRAGRSRADRMPRTTGPRRTVLPGPRSEWSRARHRRVRPGDARRTRGRSVDTTWARHRAGRRDGSPRRCCRCDADSAVERRSPGRAADRSMRRRYRQGRARRRRAARPAAGCPQWSSRTTSTRGKRPARLRRRGIAGPAPEPRRRWPRGRRSTRGACTRRRGQSPGCRRCRSPLPLHCRPAGRNGGSLGPRTLEEVTACAESPELIALLADRRFAVLTGAGISTDSGIPDYRGPDSPPSNPMTIHQFTSDPVFRQRYWARNHVGWRHMDDTLPNAGHRALAALEHAGVLTGVITQNVDLLHTKAGSRNVVNLHGTYARVICLSCGHTMSRVALAEQLEALNPGFSERVEAVGGLAVAPDADAVVTDTASFRYVDCASCGGMLKPDIVYFGESVPKDVVQQSFSRVENAEALLVAG